jgi:NAD+ synthase (glutamine-hydrolysing)
MLVMAYANKFGCLPLATGNKSELAVGYCTLYGDMVGGLAVIGDVPKTTVYELARYANRDGEVIPESILTRPPSAELKEDQTDQDVLPPYHVLDPILQLYVEENLEHDEIVEEGHDPETVRSVLRMVDRAEFKRRQAPITLRVTHKAFGLGRRLPVAQNWPR